MRYIFLILSFLLLPKQGISQIKIIKQEDYLSKPGSQIDIKIVNNNILVPIDLGYGLNVYFILDTGAKTTIITEPLLISFLKIPLERKINLRGYGSDKPIPAWVSSKFNYSLNENYGFFNQDVIILENAINLDQFLGEPVYGIIGYDFLAKHQMTIDYYRKKIYIKHPSTEKKIEKMRRKKKVKVFDLEFFGSKPFIRTEIAHDDYRDSLLLLVDTGFSGALSFYPNKKTTKYLTNPIIDHYQGYGMNGLILSKFKKIDELQISKRLRMYDVSSHFIDSISLQNISHNEFSDGSIGNDVLKRFQVSFDYDNKKLYLRPLKFKTGDPFLYNRAGIRVLYKTTEKGSGYVVQSVRKDSNAEKSGLKEKDKLISINGKLTKNMSMTKVYEELNRFDNDERQLIINRQGKQLSVNFEINRIAEWN